MGEEVQDEQGSRHQDKSGCRSIASELLIDKSEAQAENQTAQGVSRKGDARIGYIPRACSAMYTERKKAGVIPFPEPLPSPGFRYPE